MSLKEQLFAWVFPNRCLICNTTVKGTKAVCEDCGKSKTASETTYISVTSRGKKDHYLPCHTAAPYSGGLMTSMRRFKFGGKTSYAKKFAELMEECNLDFFQFDVITYVPMAKEKERKRGYNQSKLLAKVIAAAHNIECESLLKRINSGENQKNISSRKRRAANVRGAFTACGSVKGRRILLVDDIITTGSTLSECAKSLYNSGAAEVCCICALHTPK